VRAFYGLLGYYRLFIEGFATIADPLTRLTRKGTKFVWSSEADEAFARLKAAMLEVPALAFPCPDRPCILDTDSSDVAYGSVLSQLVEVKSVLLRSFRASCRRRSRITVRFIGNFWQSLLPYSIFATIS